MVRLDSLDPRFSSQLPLVGDTLFGIDARGASDVEDIQVVMIKPWLGDLCTHTGVVTVSIGHACLSGLARLLCISASTPPPIQAKDIGGCDTMQRSLPLHPNVSILLTPNAPTMTCTPRPRVLSFGVNSDGRLSLTVLQFRDGNVFPLRTLILITVKGESQVDLLFLRFPPAVSFSPIHTFAPASATNRTIYASTQNHDCLPPVVSFVPLIAATRPSDPMRTLRRRAPDIDGIRLSLSLSAPPFRCCQHRTARRACLMLGRRGRRLAVGRGRGYGHVNGIGSESLDGMGWACIGVWGGGR
ncbi:hypothetical protein R3P38DRAFT_3207323 [Favolaschia claudopus]|uniref:Uncharacterized protein n=1 Tax=Favolaschia claudopus TaxID=2862362 RepID=A0AAW0AJB9_9AGAR